MKWTACFISTLFLATTVLSVTKEEHLRIDRLEEMLLAPCCYREPVSRHQSEVAIEMRREIACMVAGGKTDHEILDYYIDKYGKAVLAEPQGLEGWVVRGIPFLLLLLGGGVVCRLVWNWRSRVQRPVCQDHAFPGSKGPAQDPIPAEFRGRIESELKDMH